MPKKVALISDHASPLAAIGGVDSGGQNIYVAQVARELGALGYGVDVYTRRDREDLPEVVGIEPNVRVIHVPAGPPRFVRKEDLLPLMDHFAEHVASRCRQYGGYDLVHANFFMSGMVALELKRRLGIPFVVTFHALGRVRRLHQGEADEFPAERLEIEDRIIARADGIIAECPQDRADLTSLYCADPRRVTTIPCGFDTSELWPVARPLARRALGLRARERIILNVGRMVPRKGLDNIIRGVARLIHDYGIEAKLVLVGGNAKSPDPALTPEIGRLGAIADAEGIARNVVFTGQRGRDVLKLYYSAADVFVTTPWYEPFGITPLEAMACATPVIGSDVGGIRYSVVDGVTGALVPPRDPEALAGRLAAYFRHPEQARAFRHNAVERVNRHFTWPQVTAAVAGFYENVIADSAALERRRVAAAA